MAKTKLSVNKRIDFYDFIISLLGSGKGLQEACEEIDSTIEMKAKEWGVLGALIKDKGKIYKEDWLVLIKGKSLPDVLKGSIPENEVMMLMTGNQGRMSDALQAARKEAQNSKVMFDTMIKGVTYPSFVFLIVMGLMYWLGQNLFPEFTGIKDVSEWPGYARSIFWMTTNLHIWVPIMLLVFSGIGFLIYQINKRVVGKVREQIHWIPPFNVVRAVVGANFLSTLANLMSAGEPIKEALEKMSKNSKSPYLNHYITKSLTAVRAGGSAGGPGEIIQSQLFGLWVQIKIEIYGRGTMEEFISSIETIAEDSRQKAMNSVSQVSGALNALMLVSAGTLIMSTVAGIYSITQSLA